MDRAAWEEAKDFSKYGTIIPSHGDFLIGWSTAPGFVSWRHPDEGSAFIQTLCRELQSAYENFSPISPERSELVQVLTRVSNIVGREIEFELENDSNLDS